MGRKHLGELEQLVMMAVLQLGDTAYGTAILRELNDRGNRKISPGGLYAILDRLESKGFVASILGDPTPGRGGKPKRFVSITERGLLSLREARAAWMRMSEGLEEALE